MRDLLSGNTFLIQISDFDYIFVESCVYKFTIKGDEITEYISPDGNNDIFYPIAYGKKYVYFLGFEEKVPVSVIPESLMDPQKEYLLTGVYLNRQYIGKKEKNSVFLTGIGEEKGQVSFNGYKSSINNMKCLKEK